MKSLAKRIKDVQKEEKEFYQSNGEKILTHDQKSQLNAALDSIESSI
jgi:Ulp1 family protease